MAAVLRALRIRFEREESADRTAQSGAPNAMTRTQDSFTPYARLKAPAPGRAGPTR